MRRQSASVTGASTPARPSARASRGTDSSASTAWPIRWGISAAGTPSASSSPARRFRLWGASAVATRSPVPASPIRDSGRAPCSSAKRHTSAKMCPAAAPAALRPCASVAPAARAAAFFAAPASSTPTGSFDTSHTTPASVNMRASDSASTSSVEAATSPAPWVTISRAWAGPPMQAMRSGASCSRNRTVGAVPSGGTRPLARDTTAARGPRPAAASPAITSSSPREGTARNT